MNGLKLLILCLVVSSIAFSQTLKPTKIQKDSVVYRCFDELQTKTIVKIIVGKQYSDSIQDISSQVVASQDSIISAQKSLIKTIRSMNENSQSQITNLNILNATLRLNTKEAQEEARRMKKRRWLYFGAGVISAATITYIVK